MDSCNATLQRRVAGKWKAVAGPPRRGDVPLAYQPGEIVCEFHARSSGGSTVRGEPFPHAAVQLYAWPGAAGHARWGTGESFVALSEGLQERPAAAGGVAHGAAHRIGLFGCHRNRDGSYASTSRRYQALCAHTTLLPANTAACPKNAIVEAPPWHVKRRLEEAAGCRGSCDFDEPAEYRRAASPRVQCPQCPTARRYEQEFEVWAACCFDRPDYELLTVRVRSTSMGAIEVRQVV